MSNQGADQQGNTEKLKIYASIVTAVIALIGTIIGALAAAGVFKPPEPKVTPQTPIPVQVTYSGYVFQNGTKNPVPSILVVMELQGGDKKEAKTDSEGRYQFNDLEVISRLPAKLVVDAEGYQHFDRNITIPAEDNIVAPDILLALASSPALATETTAPTVTLAPTLTATEVAAQTATQAPVQIKTLADGCISTQTWKYDSKQADVKNSVTESDGCYSTGKLGIYADSSGVLNILLPQNTTKNTITSGIYTASTLPNSATIEFTVKVSSMYLNPPAATPTYITFSIASASDPMNILQTARFKFQVNNLKDAFVYARIASSGSLEGTIAKKGQKNSYPSTSYTLVVDGKAMKIYTGTGDKKIKLSIEDVILPDGPYVFYIGYEQPTGAGIDADVTNLKINGQAP
jgi:hypothetical protein